MGNIIKKIYSKSYNNQIPIAIAYKVLNDENKPLVHKDNNIETNYDDDDIEDDTDDYTDHDDTDDYIEYNKYDNNNTFIQKLIIKLSDKPFTNREVIYKLLDHLTNDNNTSITKNTINKNKEIQILINKVDNFIHNPNINNLHKDYLSEFYLHLIKFSYIPNILNDDLEQIKQYCTYICEDYEKYIKAFEINKCMQVHLNTYNKI